MRKSTESGLSRPLMFEPLFMERIWGGRRLEALFGKRLPPGVLVGESWEIVDRPEAQSTVREGQWRGETLHELWMQHRREVFGDVADAPRFPLLIKLLDAQEKLSLQVHPPAEIAAEFGGQSKTEFWYVAHAGPTAEIYVGLKKERSRAHLESALETGTVEEHVHRVAVQTGDAMFLPSGRLHAIGAGNVLVEIQENSDTTFRLFDWNRPGKDGAPRTLHVEKSLRSIDFADYEPELISATGETLLEHPFFEVQKWALTTAREASASGTFAIVVCLSGEVRCAGVTITAGEFFLIPAAMEDRWLQPGASETALLRITIGRSNEA